MDINNRVVQTHHQLACAAFCHAMNSNGTSKKVVTTGRIFNFDSKLKAWWTLAGSFVGSMVKKRKDKVVCRFSHAFLRASISIEDSHRQSIPRLTDRDRTSSVIRFDRCSRRSSRTRRLSLFFSFLFLLTVFLTCFPDRIHH